MNGLQRVCHNILSKCELLVMMYDTGLTEEELKELRHVEILSQQAERTALRGGSQQRPACNGCLAKPRVATVKKSSLLKLSGK